LDNDSKLIHEQAERPEMAHPDLDVMLNALLPFAQQMLAKHGEFYPFGASLKPNGEIVQIAVDTGIEHPNSADVIKLLVDGLRNRAAKEVLRAAAICCDVRTIPPGETEKRDAINVQLAHVSGESADVYLPYVKDGSHDYLYGQIFATQGTLNVFN
jgi:hypothetical protein